MAYNYSLEGPKWGATAICSAGGTVTWSIDTSASHFFDYVNLTVTGFLADITSAFNRWEQVANIDFVQVADGAGVDIRLGESSLDGPGNTLGWTEYSFSGSRFNFVEVAFDSAEHWTDALLYKVALHEIGHALGLDHHTADPSIMQPIIGPSITDLQPYDIATIQHLYGAAPLAIVGDVKFGNTDAYFISGTGDFNADGATDIVWQSKTSGQAEIWAMSGGKIISDTPIGNLSGYNLLGTGDFNGNGASDIIWQNKTSGQMEIWSMSNGHMVGDTMYGNLSGYSMLGTGDFSHDGSADIIWQNKTTGATEIWNMKNGNVSSSTQVGNLSGYNLLGTSDLNHDGNTDIVWQNKGTGIVDVWFMGNGHLIADYNYGNMQGFKLLATGDYNHDGNNDLLWQNTSTKEVFDWIISPTTGRPTADVTSFGTQAPNFNVIGSGDFFHDGGKDLVWQNTVTHQTEIWDPQHGVVAQHDFLIV
jgi:hypothetical protein